MAVWICLPALAWGQEQKVTVDLRDAKVQEVLMEIKRQTGLNFVYSPEQLAALPARDVEAKNETVDALMERLLEGSGLEHAFEMGSIVIRRKADAKVQKQVEEMRITGTVKDNFGHVLPGVTVLVKGTTIGVATDVDGKYALSVPAGKYVLVFSMVGMKLQEVTVSVSKEINVVLEEEAAQMDEVVVTGIFNKPRESYTGAVTVVTEKELKMFKGANMLQTLRNIDPAFNIVQNNTVGSNPNVLPEINIRGTSSLPKSINELNQGVQAQLNAPLIIMDGFEISLQNLMDFNDEDIE